MSDYEELVEQDEFYEHFKYVASEGQVPLRVDKFLMNFVENATRNKVQQAAKAGNVLVNEIPVKPNYKVKPKDVVRVVFAHPPHENLLVAEDIPLDIIYSGDIPPNPTELLANGNLESVLEQLRAIYDYVIVDIQKNVSQLFK